MATDKDPNTPAGGSTFNEDLVQELSKTIHAKVLNDLEDPLAEVVNEAVRKAIQKPARLRSNRPSNSRPSSGGKCAKIWKTLESETAKRDRQPSLGEVRKLAKRKHWNSNTARIQYYRWRSAQSASA